jgi:hypothetical protein
VGFDIIYTKAMERYPTQVGDNGVAGFHFSHNFIFSYSPMWPVSTGVKDLLTVNFIA